MRNNIKSNMYKKTFLVIILTLAVCQTSIAQTEIDYNHCNCKEIINYKEENKSLKNGDYSFTCINSLNEKGAYKNGQKDGLWTVKNENGITISKIEYSEGNLQGSYELYFYKGDPKLTAHFKNNEPKGEWKYYNEKGKIIKQGTYKNGIPIGTWKVFDKKGKKIIAEYDFDKYQPVINANSKIKNSYLPQDDESGEYIIIYYPERKNITNNIPFEGSILSNNLFIDLLNIPYVLMNTETQYNFIVKGKITEGKLEIEDMYSRKASFNINSVSFPFIAQTNSPKKIKKINHTDILIEKTMERIQETLMVLGPWVSNTNETFVINIPFVLNKINGI